MQTGSQRRIGGWAMRISNGFDRISTEEELHQVLDILGELGRSGWSLPGESSAPQNNALWADAFLDDPTDAESLAEILAQKPELKN